MRFGLIGKDVSQSYSKIIHEKFGLYNYELLSLSHKVLGSFLKSGCFSGLNVTMPYKKAVIPYCDQISDCAKKIGSVNTLKFGEDGILSGYNTDYFGLKYTINRSKIDIKNKKVIIMGSGGTSQTAKTLAEDLGAREILVFSREGKLNYGNIYEHKNSEIIINTTPIGMYPKISETLIDIGKFENLSGAVDVIYNPLYTRFLLSAKKTSAKTAGGLPMLVAQAKDSAEIFTGRKIPDSEVKRVLRELTLEISNIVLIGMPGSGKSSAAKILKNMLERKSVDTDEEIEKIFKMKVPEIFERLGEKAFRKQESEILEKLGKEKGLIISTGGGAVTNENAYENLKQNGRIYWIKRDLKKLEISGRPLSKNLTKLKKIYEKRKSIYESFCDKKIENNGSIKDLAQKIKENFYENTCH